MAAAIHPQNADNGERLMKLRKPPAARGRRELSVANETGSTG
jgi:hypothetical protein